MNIIPQVLDDCIVKTQTSLFNRVHVHIDPSRNYCWNFCSSQPRRCPSNKRPTRPDTSQRHLALDIFINNFAICLLMFVPIIGTAAGLFVLFSTGVAINAQASVLGTLQ
jgi:hypothetical protein